MIRISFGLGITDVPFLIQDDPPTGDEVTFQGQSVTFRGMSVTW